MVHADLGNTNSLHLAPNGGTVTPVWGRGADGSNVLPTDTAIANAINTPASDTDVALSASIGSVGRVSFISASMLVGASIDYTGVSDSTTAVQAFIDAQSAGAIITIPPGGILKLTSAITLNQGKSLVGQGYRVIRDAVTTFGDAAYATAGNFGGTVIRSGVTSGAAILLGDTSPTRTRVAGFVLIGPGSGTSTGIQIGRSSGTPMAPVGPSADDVMVCNFSKGWRFEEMNEGILSGIAARGCTTGFSLGANVNANAFLMINAQRCGTGVDMDSTCLGDAFTSPICQNITTAGMVMRGRFHTVTSPYTEECAVPISMVGAAQCVVQSPATEGSGTPTMDLDAVSNQNQFLGLRTVTAAKLITNAGSGNVFVGQLQGLTDTGANTLKIDTNDGRISGLSWLGKFTATGSILPQRITGTLASTLTAAAAGAGSMIYSNSLGKPAWSDGTNWRDAAGTIVT